MPRPAIAGPWGGGEIDELTEIIRLDAPRPVAHCVEIEIMHPRLVQDHMRELGKPLLVIRDPTAAHDPGPVGVVGRPERNLVDPIGLLHHPVAEAEGLEHLHRPAGDAVGLAEREGARFLLDDPGLDVGKGR